MTRDGPSRRVVRAGERTEYRGPSGDAARSASYAGMMPATITVLDAPGTKAAFEAALNWCTDVHVHVAWGTQSCPLHASLLANAAKVKLIRVGIDFMGTDPDFIQDWIEAAPHVLRIVKLPSGVFHPKVYCFDKGDERRILIGSSNLTGPAFGKNAETNVLVAGSPGGLALTGVAALTTPVGRSPALGWLKRYRARWTRAQKAKRKADAKVLALAGVDNAFDLAVGFPDYVTKLSSASTDAGHGHEVEDWLRSIKSIRSVLNVTDPSAMDREQWRILAGTPKSAEIEGEAVDLRFFGWVRGSQAQRLLRQNTRKTLAKALAAIPASGEVTRQQFDTFSKAFVAAGFTTSMLGTASRLLCVWRPDRFAPCNGGSRGAFRDALQELPLSTLDDYFEAHRVLWKLPWATADRPKDSVGGAIWDARVALLDVLFYDVAG